MLRIKVTVSAPVIWCSFLAPCVRELHFVVCVLRLRCALTPCFRLNMGKIQHSTRNHHTPFTSNRNNGRHTTIWPRSGAVFSSCGTACKWLKPRYSGNWQQNQIESRLLKRPSQQSNTRQSLRGRNAGSPNHTKRDFNKQRRNLRCNNMGAKK